MRPDTLDLLRCPYCGGHLAVAGDLLSRRDGDDVVYAVLRCHCSSFPVVGGIPVMSVEGAAYTAREEIEAGDSAAALRTMLELDEDAAELFLSRCAGPDGGCAAAIEALGPDFAENRYFLYRFSDPTFVVADAVVRVLGAAVLGENGRAIDICGGSGHLTRAMQSVTKTPPVLMDWVFPKLWLAKSIVAPGAEVVCADAHSALPFAAAAFRLAVCSDAFHYIWSKAALARDMIRLIDDEGAVALTHAHNALQENPSAGMPLPPSAYREAFEGIEARVFSERALLADVLAGRVDLGRRDSPDVLDADPAITLVGSRRVDVFATHPIAPLSRGVLRINPLYRVTRAAETTVLRLEMPSESYAAEYAAAHAYLPDEVRLTAAQARAVEAGDSGGVPDLMARRVVLVVPERYL